MGGGTHVDRTTLLNDDDVDASIETPGFPKKMNGKERTGRSTPDDGNAFVVLEAPLLRRCAAHGLRPFGKDVRSVPAADRRPLREKHSILVEGNYTTGKPLNCGKRTRGWSSSAAARYFVISEAVPRAPPEHSYGLPRSTARCRARRGPAVGTAKGWWLGVY